MTNSINEYNTVEKGNLMSGHKSTNRAGTYIKRQTAMNKYGWKNYREFLKSDRWKEIKDISKTNYENADTCCFCGSKDNVVLHHTKYQQTNFKRAVMRNLVPACSICHYAIHEIEKEFNIDTYRATLVYNIVYHPEAKQFIWEQKQKDKPIEPRVMSMRIIPRSGLPETLHHSIHACLAAWKNLTVDKFIEKYTKRKTKKKDEEMLGLFNKNLPQVRAFLNTILEAS